MKKYKIIYDDQDLLVVCKFAGLAVQSARVSTPDLMSLLRNEMLERGEKKPYLGLVNRLDQPVEGIVLIGKRTVEPIHPKWSKREPRAANEANFTMRCSHQMERTHF